MTVRSGNDAGDWVFLVVQFVPVIVNGYVVFIENTPMVRFLLLIVMKVTIELCATVEVRSA